MLLANVAVSFRNIALSFETRLRSTSTLVGLAQERQQDYQTPPPTPDASFTTSKTIDIPVGFSTPDGNCHKSRYSFLISNWFVDVALLALAVALTLSLLAGIHQHNANNSLSTPLTQKFTYSSLLHCDWLGTWPLPENKAVPLNRLIKGNRGNVIFLLRLNQSRVAPQCSPAGCWQ